MKVFLVSLILLILVAGLFFMVSSQESIAPIVYLTYPLDDEISPPNYDFEGMDVNTGRIIFDGATEEADCPYNISPDGQWLQYGSGPYSGNMDYYFLNLETLSTQRSQSPLIGEWFLDSSGLLSVGRADELGNEFNIYRYNIDNNIWSIAATVSWPPPLMRVGNSFVYLHLEYNKNIIGIYQLDGQFVELELPSSQFKIHNFSNDGRFLLFSARSDNSDLVPSTLYLIEISTGALQEIDGADLTTGGTWHPITNQLVYKDKQFNLILFDPDTKESSIISFANTFGDNMSYHWSPDGQYLAIEGVGPETVDIDVVDFSKSMVYSLGTSYVEHWGAGFLRWTSPTELAYIHTDIRGNNDAGEIFSDIYLYDAENQTNRNLTNTPDIREFQRCLWG